MASESNQPAFHAILTRTLKREGFTGDHIWVGRREGRLDLIGETGGEIRIPLVAQYSRARSVISPDGTVLRTRWLVSSLISGLSSG